VPADAIAAAKANAQQIDAVEGSRQWDGGQQLAHVLPLH
jgi:hypothetical protein